MGINSTVVKTWIADQPRCEVRATTKKKARAQITVMFNTKVITNLIQLKP